MPRAVAFLLEDDTAIVAVPPRRRDFWRVLLGRFQPDVESFQAERPANLPDDDD